MTKIVTGKFAYRDKSFTSYRTSVADRNSVIFVTYYKYTRNRTEGIDIIILHCPYACYVVSTTAVLYNNVFVCTYLLAKTR